MGTAGIVRMRVWPVAGSPARGWLDAGGGRFPVALGRSGIRTQKREGDGATPRGRFGLVELRYRPDRLPRPQSGLPVRPIRPDDGWCDQPGDRNYNRDVRLPYPASCETLWRTDSLYDLLIVLDHNQLPRLPCGGSAIFLHLARSGFAPTEGCVAFRRRDLERLLPALSPRTEIEIA
jgi:L,D-peptidoglycan transpeptidase YkuD (ErfK/YbiS/YcfS/YnhG family)